MDFGSVNNNTQNTPTSQQGEDEKKPLDKHLSLKVKGQQGSTKLRLLASIKRMFLTRISKAFHLCRRPSCLLIGTNSSGSKSQPDNGESNRESALNEDDDDDWSNMDASLKPSSTDSQNMSEGSDQGVHHANDSDEDYMKPQPRKERIRKCLAKLKRGPDGRFINVLEVTSDINMLIAAYQSLKAESRPTYLIEDSDEEDSMEGIDIQRFRKLQKRLRSGTYRFGTAKEPKKK